MHVLHLFSNWKWTGPAEPAVNLAAQCTLSDMDVTFLCGRPDPERNFRLAEIAFERGLHVETPLILSKHRRLIGDMADVRRLRTILQETPPDIIHCHMQNDTRIAARAVGRTGGAKIVRTIYEGSVDAIRRPDISIIRGLDGVIAVSAAVAEHARSEMAVQHVTHIHGAVDLKRFDQNKSTSSMREKWGVDDGAPVMGIVARIQKRRRFDLLLEAFRDLLASRPDAVLVIVGRGTKKREVAELPVEKMGISDNVVFAGYLDGDDYVAALAAFDLLVYLVPGTDGSCRTVREAMAMGLPVVSSRRGILPELVDDGVTGITCIEDAAELRSAFEKILASREDLAAMGSAARERALREFPLERQAEAVKRFYETVIGS